MSAGSDRSSGWKWFSDQERDTWPLNHKRCRGCGEVLPFEDFGKAKSSLFGLAARCNTCRRPDAQKDYASRKYERVILDRARSRATAKGLPFDLTLDDIVVPDACPVLGIRLERGEGLMSDKSPSLDRLNPSLGYVRGNVTVISNRANRIKSDASIRELLLIAHWMGRHVVAASEKVLK